ncbi:hypothetical protein AXF42_Ash016112 [Apostasia shenzhenica]|uniref:Uncharacterized protein n=1 Tax=Apostasia shenzhenica TaxID=1088818 RepID=A0A2I0B3F0_9ASPA|nr:hypothetical protein AXF42_Ash016112 [Apostasia shenzhenica]
MLNVICYDSPSSLLNQISFRLQTAEKVREFVGEEDSSKSGKFTFLNCLDMGSGTFSCFGKEGIKLYVYSLRNKHVDKARQQATEVALTEALNEGLDASAAVKQAQKVGQKAAKQASRQAKRIVGPIMSAGWDSFEAIYYGGTTMEGVMRGAGTLLGAYAGGFHGEEMLGKLGYLLGSHLGSWVGGRIGLMVYDVGNGVSRMLEFFTSEGSTESEDDKGLTDSFTYKEQTFSEDAARNEGFSGYEPSGEDSDDQSEPSVESSEEGPDGWGFFQES